MSSENATSFEDAKSNRSGSSSNDPRANGSSVSRRDAVKTLGGAGLAGLLGSLGGPVADAAPKEPPSTAQASIGAAQANYVFPRAPLADVSYAKLPLGAVEPKGWLGEQLRRMGDGMAGRLGELYANVSSENAWVGGNGDNWERGPYWIDGLVPLAYTLGDDELIAEAERWIAWSIQSQQPSGYFGPDPDKSYDEAPEGKHGAFLQTDNAADWWPRMVMLKAMRSYHDATGDERVLGFMTNYFRYQQRTLPETPLGHWTWWAKMRGGENQESIYWLYNRTGEDFLLDLARTVFEQTADWTEGFLENDPPSWHGVNVGMGVKQPVVNYLQAKDAKYLHAAREGLDWLMREHGQPQGMFSGDEPLHGTAPTQGTEMCTVVELMYSLQNLVRTTGQVRYMDHLERVAYNALPTQHKDDYMGRQYYQQPNQIRISDVPKNFKTGGTGMRLVYGLTSGYPCCTTNMHQGWPKYARNLWMATPDGGLAALFYAANGVDARVGADGTKVHVEEKTDYPFDDAVRFELSSREGAVYFPLHLRIPAWVDGKARIRVNGRRHATPEAGQIVKIGRRWKDGDTLELTLPMTVSTSRWHERSAAVERGPLVYALRIGEDWQQIDGDDYEPRWEERYKVPTWEVFPRAPWNYGLVFDRDAPADAFEVVEDDVPDYPWSLETVPVKLVAKGKRLPQWNAYHEGAGPLPPSPADSEEPTEEITLVPYGASTLRISEFPVVRT